ncbi:MAG: hypothetical protein ACOCX1_01475 [Fimbriimonadaceae bacterium]
MLSALLAASVLAARDLDVADFFPLNPGDQWTYREQVGGLAMMIEEETGDARDVVGLQATPIVSEVKGTGSRAERKESVFYRIDDNAVFVVAFKQEQALAEPYPIVRWDGGTTTWEFKGTAMYFGVPADMEMKGRTVFKEDVEVMGSKVDALEVTLETTLYADFDSEIKSKSVSLYARNVGLVEMTSEEQIGDSRAEKRVRKLVAYSPAS